MVNIFELINSQRFRDHASNSIEDNLKEYHSGRDFMPMDSRFKSSKFYPSEFIIQNVISKKKNTKEKKSIFAKYALGYSKRQFSYLNESLPGVEREIFQKGWDVFKLMDLEGSFEFSFPYLISNPKDDSKIRYEAIMGGMDAVDKMLEGGSSKRLAGEIKSTGEFLWVVGDSPDRRSSFELVEIVESKLGFNEYIFYDEEKDVTRRSIWDLQSDFPSGISLYSKK